MDILQFYPTPDSLARKVWAILDRKHFSRVLEPSAGRGDLLKPMHDAFNGFPFRRQ